MRCLRAALLAAAAAASPEVGPVADFVDAILHGRAVPLGLRRCPLAKACGADELAGAWLRTPQGRAYELSEGPTPSTIRVASDDGIRSASLPPGRAVCVGGVVPRSASPGILLHEGVGSTAGHFGEGCRTIEFDDGTTLYRPADRLPHGAADASASRGAPSKPDADAAVADAAVADDACSTVELEFVGASRPGASALREGWTSASARYQYVEAGGPVLRVEASIDSSGEVARLGSEVTALDDLGFCVGGVFLLNYTVAHARADEAVLHGSTGGMAELAPPGGNAPGNFSGTSAADTALQPWACPLCVDVASRPCPAQLTHATPDYEHEPSAARVASASSDLDGRSSNVQLPIFSVEVAPAGGGARRGLWLGPEYSGAWRLDAYAVESGTRLYVGLPTMLFTMRRGEAVALPRVAFGSWAASADAPLASDWSNAVRYAISRHLTPSVGGSRPVPFASYQGLGGLPEWQTEDELLRLSRRAGHRPGGLGLESFVFDAGLYYPLNATGCVDPAAPWCDHSAWWTRQGDYLPVRSRFPKRGFDSLARSITGPDGFDQMGSWITPQAQPGTSALDKRPELYLRPGPAPCACETSYVLNLALPAAQDFFFGQWVELIERFNNSRIWFDFNTAPRATHWNFHEERGRQGLLELGFWRGLYAVFDRVRAKYPRVWIETTSSGGRAIDLGMISRSHSIWINDDSKSDLRNRALRSGANHFLPAHYLQNAYFAPKWSSPADGAASIGRPSALVGYFNGVLQLGQGIGFWDGAALAAGREYVRAFKRARGFLDPLRANYHRLFDAPFRGAERCPRASRVTPAGWVYDDPVTGRGILAVMRQGSNARVRVPLTWWRADELGSPPKTAPKARVEASPRFALLAGDADVTWAVGASSIDFAFSAVDQAVLLSFERAVAGAAAPPEETAIGPRSR